MVMAGFELRMINSPPWRHRRRQLAILAGLIAAALVGAIVGSGGGPRNRERPAARSQASRAFVAPVSPAAAFVQDPYMGVSCHGPNTIACDRVGLSVWLARRATVTATIAGEPSFRLNAPGWSYVAHQDGKPLYVYAGFLQPAGLTTRLHVRPTRSGTWLGADAPTPLVRFRIEYGHGEVVITQQHVSLHAGWG